VDDKDLEKMRHSASHILAMAVLKLYPEAKLAIGPAIKDGFYYDIDLPQSISDSDLSKIEKEMKKFIKEGFAFKKRYISRREAKKTLQG